MTSLPEKEPFIANAILNCLRRWERDAKPCPFVMTLEDLDSLEEWSRTLHEHWDRAAEVYKEHGFPLRIRPVRIGR